MVTNLHVIEGASKVVATLSDGRRLATELLGFDETLDIAVLKIEAEDLRPLAFADSEEVRAGQLVLRWEIPSACRRPSPKASSAPVSGSLPARQTKNFSRPMRRSIRAIPAVPW